jgi:hypothetical protein
MKTLAREEAERELADEGFDKEVQVQKNIIRAEKVKKPLSLRLAEVLAGRKIGGPTDLPEAVQIGIYELDGYAIKTFLWEKDNHEQIVSFDVHDEDGTYMGCKTVKIDIRRLKD